MKNKLSSLFVQNNQPLKGFIVKDTFSNYVNVTLRQRTKMMLDSDLKMPSDVLDLKLHSGFPILKLHPKITEYIFCRKYFNCSSLFCIS